MSRSKIFLFFCACFFVGIAFGFKFQPELNYLYLALAGMVMVFTFGYMYSNSKTILLLAGLFFLSIGTVRSIYTIKINEFENILETKVSLEGVIVEDVDVRTDKQMLTFLPNGYSQKILITTNFSKEYFYGDYVVLEGKIKKVENFGDFDYEKYLERYNVYALSNYPKILVLQTNQANFAKYYLLKFKASCVEYLSNFLAEPKLSLLLGILIGAKKTLPKDLTQNFSKVGLSHMVAVSGYNISVLILSLSFLAKFIGRKFSFWLSIFIILAFSVMAGVSASVLRASVMGGLLLLALRLGRPYSFAPAICFSAGVMLLLNPKILLWDIGFALSFSATLGIVYGVPLLENLFPNFPEWFGLRSVLFTTVCAIVVTLPLSLLYFGQGSAVAILANILVLPLVPLIMLLGFFIFIPIFSAGFALLTTGLLSYVLLVVNFLANLPFASFTFSISVRTFWVLYGFIFLLYIFLSSRVKRLKTASVDSKLHI